MTTGESDSENYMEIPQTVASQFVGSQLSVAKQVRDIQDLAQLRVVQQSFIRSRASTVMHFDCMHDPRN